MPSKNVEFWEAKFRRNVERDKRALAELDELGWTAITVWECDLKRDAIDATMERVIEAVRTAGTGGRAPTSARTAPNASAPSPDADMGTSGTSQPETSTNK